jgi:hypothetical protein
MIINATVRWSILAAALSRKAPVRLVYFETLLQRASCGAPGLMPMALVGLLREGIA